MSFSLTKHSGKCSSKGNADQPCTNCRLTTFLRNWLEPGSFPIFLSIAGVNPSLVLPEIVRKPAIPWTAPEEPEQILGTPLSSLQSYDDLDVRTLNCLRNDSIVTVEHLLSKSREELMRTPNFGKISLARLHDFLVINGYKPPW